MVAMDLYFFFIWVTKNKLGTEGPDRTCVIYNKVILLAFLKAYLE